MISGDLKLQGAVSPSLFPSVDVLSSADQHVPRCGSEDRVEVLLVRGLHAIT
jgi:hypothetical protein